jgi:hypothetical protein
MAALPLLTTQSEELHQPIRPQPQRPPPPSKTKPAVAGPAELVTCDQTIEHTVRFCKQTLGWTTPGPAIPSRPTAGPGWCWPPTPSYAWPARSPATSGCPGSGPDPSRGCHRCGCAAAFRSFWLRSARRLPRRNPPVAPQAGQPAAAPVPPSTIRRSTSSPRSQGRSRPRPRRPPDRPQPAPPSPLTGQRPTRHARRVTELRGSW